MPTNNKETKKTVTTTKKATPKKTTTKSSATAKKSTKTKTSKASTTKKSTTKTTKPTPKKKNIKQAKPVGIKISKKETEGNLLDILSAPTEANVPQVSSQSKAPSKPSPKGTAQKAKSPSSKSAPKKPVKVQPKVKHRTKLATKEEKQLFKRLSDSFNYLANLTMVIEERMLDKTLVPDLTLSEIHVLEVVNEEAAMPMTKVANKLKITVGSLTTCVNRLVKKEYLSRIRDDVDHRVIKVSTTLKAKKVLKIHDSFHEEILLTVLDGITLKDATKVLEQFERTLENYINPKEKNYEKPIIPTLGKKK